MSATTSSSDNRKRRRPYDVADGCGVYKYVRARKLEIDTSATTASSAARIIGHSVAENTTLHGVKHLRRAKGTTCWLLLANCFFSARCAYATMSVSVCRSVCL